MELSKDVVMLALGVTVKPFQEKSSGLATSRAADAKFSLSLLRAAFSFVVPAAPIESLCF